MQNKQLSEWEGDFGDAYTARNASNDDLPARMLLWKEIIGSFYPWLGAGISALEVGANIGQNLEALRRIMPVTLAGAEPNRKALNILKSRGFAAHAESAQHLPWPDNSFDIVFTCGVLIHIRPDGQKGGAPAPLLAACREISRVAKFWVIAVEYFSDRPVEVPYRGTRQMLWARDFGQYYIDKCGLEPVSAGFSWRALTGLDNLTWWVLRKPWKNGE